MADPVAIELAQLRATVEGFGRILASVTATAGASRSPRSAFSRAR